MLLKAADELRKSLRYGSVIGSPRALPVEPFTQGYRDRTR
jgi:hypothetical protein